MYKVEIGDVFGKLVVVGNITATRWLCKCSCGNTKEAYASVLVKKNIKSCGCLKREATVLRNTTHNLSKSVEYRHWKGMLDRCYNLNNKRFNHYNGRGIKVHEDFRHNFVAWNYYYPEESDNPPHVLQNVEDYDLWKFEFNYTKPIVNYIRSLEYNFDTWDRIMRIDALLDMDEYFKMVNSGQSIERIQQKQIKEFYKNKIIVDIGNKLVPALNLPYFYSSDAAGMLAKEHDFGVTFWYTSTGVTFSLRSTVESEVDVAKIAEQYGGGGHKNASGFSVDFHQFSDMLMHVEYVKE